MPGSADPSSDPKFEIGHVLLLDVIGYSTLLLDAQAQVMADLNRIVRRAMHFRVADVAGKLVCLPTGDGMALVFFGDPEAPLETAIEVARALKSHPDIRLRMGIHSGPVSRVLDVNEKVNVAGAGIDQAQRVMDCGDAGHILLSRRVAYDLAPSPRWNPHLYDLGDCEVKHDQKVSLVNYHTEDLGNPEVPEKVKRSRAAAVARTRQFFGLPRGVAGAIGAMMIVMALLGVFLFQRHIRMTTAPLPVAPPEKSIAVLPFADLSPGKDQEYFCDGMSEEILDALARIDGLRVIARTSSFAFKDKGAESAEIGRKLNVATLLQGSLRREGNRIRVTAQLVSARDGIQLWSKTFEKELKGVFEVQDEITGQIVEALRIKLAMAPRPQLPDPAAYDLYLKGLYFSNKSSEEDLRIALGYFEKALEKDPNLGRAWTGVAKAWLWLSDAYVKPAEAFPKVEAAANKALALDDHDAEAHAYLAECRRVLSYDLPGAEAELKRALELDPNSPFAHIFLAILRTAQGDWTTGLSETKAAVRLDPLSPIVGNFEVQIDLATRRLEEAFAAAKRIMEIDPDYVYFEPELALVYREQGKLSQALEIYERLEATQKQPVAGLALTYARLGRTADARRVLTRLVTLADTRYYPGEKIAAIYLALGDNDAAFYWLERAISEHSAPIHAIAVAPEFGALRGNPRFPEILRRIGLDPNKALRPR